MSDPLLTRRAVVTAKIESSYNVDASPTAALDALLVENPDYKIDVQTLERNFARADLDMLPHATGRKLASMSFSHEWRSNGRTHSGLIADAPKLGRLLRACGFAEAAIAEGSGQIGTINADDNNTSAPTWAAAGAGWGELEHPILYTVEVTTGGASGVAQVSITPDAKTIAASIDAAQTGVTVTSGSGLDLNGDGDLTIAPTWTGNLTLGDKWQVWVYPPGIRYMPVSSGFESVTLYMYFDGVLHILTGARGTFSVSAEAGNYAKAEFTFTGQYVDPSDTALPTSARYERQLPAMVELSDLYLDNIGAVCSQFSFDVNNTVAPRMDVNAADGYNGVRITGRDVSGNIDPEATLVADFAWWTKLTAGSQMLWRNKVGQTEGNRIFTMAPSVQLSNLSYQDREQIRTMDVPLKMSRKYGNDSIQFLFS